MTGGKCGLWLLKAEGTVPGSSKSFHNIFPLNKISHIASRSFFGCFGEFHNFSDFASRHAFWCFRRVSGFNCLSTRWVWALWSNNLFLQRSRLKFEEQSDFSVILGTDSFFGCFSAIFMNFQFLRDWSKICRESEISVEFWSLTIFGCFSTISAFLHFSNFKFGKFKINISERNFNNESNFQIFGNSSRYTQKWGGWKEIMTKFEFYTKFGPYPTLNAFKTIDCDFRIRHARPSCYREWG
jgi:hypothetical protein